MSSHLYVLCQGKISYILIAGKRSNTFVPLALDLRALEKEFLTGLSEICRREFHISFGSALPEHEASVVEQHIRQAAIATYEKTSTMDLYERMHKIAASSSTVLVDFLTRSSNPKAVSSLVQIPEFRRRFAEKTSQLMDELRHAYLFGERGDSPASPYLNKTKPIYEFVRLTLGELIIRLISQNLTDSVTKGIRMHGTENYNHFANGHGFDECTLGESVSLIHEVRSLYSFNLLPQMFTHVLGYQRWKNATSNACVAHLKILLSTRI